MNKRIAVDKFLLGTMLRHGDQDILQLYFELKSFQRHPVFVRKYTKKNRLESPTRAVSRCTGISYKRILKHFDGLQMYGLIRVSERQIIVSSSTYTSKFAQSNVVTTEKKSKKLRAGRRYLFDCLNCMTSRDYFYVVAQVKIKHSIISQQKVLENKSKANAKIQTAADTSVLPMDRFSMSYVGLSNRSVARIATSGKSESVSTGNRIKRGLERLGILEFERRKEVMSSNANHKKLSEARIDKPWAVMYKGLITCDIVSGVSITKVKKAPLCMINHSSEPHSELKYDSVRGYYYDYEPMDFCQIKRRKASLYFQSIDGSTPTISKRDILLRRGWTEEMLSKAKQEYGFNWVYVPILNDKFSQISYRKAFPLEFIVSFEKSMLFISGNPSLLGFYYSSFGSAVSLTAEKNPSKG